jgi:hypothetical protein
MIGIKFLFSKLIWLSTSFYGALLAFARKEARLRPGNSAPLPFDSGPPADEEIGAASAALIPSLDEEDADTAARWALADRLRHAERLTPQLRRFRLYWSLSSDSYYQSVTAPGAGAVAQKQPAGISVRYGGSGNRARMFTPPLILAARYDL